MSAASVLPVTTAEFALRSLRRDDLELTFAWRNDDDSRRWFHSDVEIPWDAHVRWFERYLDTPHDFVFIVDEAGSPVAQVALSHVASGSAEFGRLLVAPSERGRGLASVAISLCLRVGQEQLGVGLVRLEVIDGNERAIAAYRNAGFVPAGEAPSQPGSTVWVKVLA